MRDELRAAGEALEGAAATAEGETANRLREQADQLHDLATADRDPDHGRLARHESKLQDLADANPAARDAIETAIEHVRAFRETVPGV